MKIIETHNIAKVYRMGNNEVRALQSISITINKGEYVAFMGPSGSGKSTLMNIIGCLDTPTSGTYILNNHVVSEMTENELAEVQRRLLDRVEAERRELAREIHDGPMQELYGIIFAIDALMQSDNPAEEIKERLLSVVQSLRTISRDLRPPALTPYGLQKAIQSHLDTLQQSHPELKIVSELMPDGQLLPERVRLALYRIYQVAITNVVRHSQATQVRVALQITRDEVILEIQDNGCGFNVPERWIELARQGHLGLVGAQERAEAIGGSLQVTSEEGQGTLLRVVAPRFRES